MLGLWAVPAGWASCERWVRPVVGSCWKRVVLVQKHNRYSFVIFMSKDVYMHSLLFCFILFGTFHTWNLACKSSQQHACNIGDFHHSVGPRPPVDQALLRGTCQANSYLGRFDHSEVPWIDGSARVIISGMSSFECHPTGPSDYEWADTLWMVRWKHLLYRINSTYRWILLRLEGHCGAIINYNTYTSKIF